MPKQTTPKQLLNLCRFYEIRKHEADGSIESAAFFWAVPDVLRFAVALKIVLNPI